MKRIDVLSLCCDPTQHGSPSWIPDLTHEINSDQRLTDTMHILSPLVLKPPSTTYRAARSWLSKARFTGIVAVRRFKPALQPTLHT